MAKNRIQVTTAHISSDAQVVLPNCYFISKAVKAMLANDQLRDFFTARTEESNGIAVDPFIMDQLEITGNFLHELIDALEGKEPEDK